MRNLCLHTCFSVLQKRRHALVGQRISAFVTGITGMAAYPPPFDLMQRHECIELLPKISVTHRLFVGGTPAATLPVRQPFAHAFLNVLGIGMDHDLARALQCFKSLNDGSKFHAIVGGSRHAAVQLFLVVPLSQQRTPAAWAGVALAGPVGPDFHYLATHFGVSPELLLNWRPVATAARRTVLRDFFHAGPTSRGPATRFTADTT